MAESLLEKSQKMMRGELPQPPVAQLVGFKLVEISEGKAIVDFEAGPQHANPMGTLHGGILCDIADAAMGLAFASTLGEGESFTTLELKMNFLRPVWNAKLTATGSLVKLGRSVSMTECDITDEQGRLIARASSTCMTLRDDKAEGR